MPMCTTTCTLWSSATPPHIYPTATRSCVPPIGMSPLYAAHCSQSSMLSERCGSQARASACKEQSLKSKNRAPRDRG